MKAADISDDAVLTLIAECNDACCSYGPEAGWHGGRPGYGHEPDKKPKSHPAILWDLAKKLDVPDKVLLAKMRRLIKKGKVKGCACGCRGDFEI